MRIASSSAITRDQSSAFSACHVLSVKSRSARLWMASRAGSFRARLTSSCSSCVARHALARAASRAACGSLMTCPFALGDCGEPSRHYRCCDSLRLYHAPKPRVAAASRMGKLSVRRFRNPSLLTKLCALDCLMPCYACAAPPLCFGCLWQSPRRKACQASRKGGCQPNCNQPRWQ